MASNLDNPSLHKIEGTGQKLLHTVNEYISLVESDYNMTVDDVTSYIGCSRDYVLNSLKQHIKHIRINTVIRDAVVDYLFKEYIQLNEETYRLFIKRILFSREYFKRFILDNCVIEYLYKKIKLQGFGIYESDISKRKSIIDKLNEISFKLFGECTEPVIKSIGYFPTELYSQKELKQKYLLKYSVDFYRMIDRLGINKIKLFNNVRYDIKDFDEGVIINYKVYDKLGHQDVIDRILNVYNDMKSLKN